MSRRAAIVEEEFDDDTELPLPSRPLPNTGTRGALLEEIGVSDDDSDGDDEDEDDDGAGPASQFRPPPPAAQAPDQPSNTVTDITPYKKWTCIYPIYIDAKRPYGTGSRRIARSKSVWYPLSKDIADASSRLGLGTLHEVQKAHPRDWENPGRVRVQWKKDGRLMNGAIKTKKQLLEMISFQIQRIKPDNIPRPPYTSSPIPETAPTSSTASTTPSSKAPPSTKGKQPASKSASASAVTSKSASKSPSKPLAQSQLRLPTPPHPHPSLASRVSPYSPALPTGVLIETVKAGMNAPDPGAGASPGAGAQKGKRKVLRVRG
ncbi:signal recognition particle, SRP19 subunit [Leucogyrophana mollusca]|uniref:Signal recognition particle, SRP19 subunit n=1 Tax=Leucogyrophana mollusca TaxID=85980 RepID=A0ACB8B031_9AGAM|nr:signal recognition particle, SRP19 subunit [Leucogyrophana mollusca]